MVVGATIFHNRRRNSSDTAVCGAGDPVIEVEIVNDILHSPDAPTLGRPTQRVAELLAPPA